MDVNETLQQRKKTHGRFEINAIASQSLKNVIHNHACVVLSLVQNEALDAICAKIARIITGDPNHADSWHDVAGYATLVENIINEETPNE